MKHHLESYHIDGVVESAGTADWNVGRKADARSIKVALDNGIDIRGHRARQVRVEELESFDYILVMDSSNEIALKRVAPHTVQSRIKRIVDADVPDPYHCDYSAFKEVFETLWQGCDMLAKQIQGKP